MPRTEYAALITQYAEAYDKLLGAVSGITDHDRLTRPAPEKWCIQEILCHLMDSEIMAVGRIKRIIAEENPFLPSYDQEKFAANLHYNDMDPKGAIVTFGMLRETTSALLALVPDGQWERKGNHEERGPITLTDYLKLMVTHSEKHIAQILEIRRALGQ
jgi:hypothetical protein